MDDQFEQAIRDNLSPEGVAAIIALLQPAGDYRTGASENGRALDQVVWFRQRLLAMLGPEEFNRLTDEIGL